MRNSLEVGSSVIRPSVKLDGQIFLLQQEQVSMMLLAAAGTSNFCFVFCFWGETYLLRSLFADFLFCLRLVINTFSEVEREFINEL